MSLYDIKKAKEAALKVPRSKACSELKRELHMRIGNDGVYKRIVVAKNYDLKTIATYNKQSSALAAAVAVLDVMTDKEYHKFMERFQRREQELKNQQKLF